MLNVIPSATSRMSVAFASSSSIEMLEPVRPLKLEKIVEIIGVISRSAARGG